MFKRWRKKEAEEKPDEGFICPMCMVAFESADALQIHFVMAHGDESQQTPETKDFVCPICGKTFNKSNELQSHFDQDHDTDELGIIASTEAPVQASAVDIFPQDTTKILNEDQGSLISFDNNMSVRKESEVSLLSTSFKEIEEKTQEVLNLQQDLNDVNASLKEEKWYSTALKEEVEKITHEKNEYQNKCKDHEKEKKEMGEDFNKKLMEEKENNVKSMAEFAQLKVELAKAVESRTGTQSEQKDVELRSSQLAAENAGLKAKLEEEQTNKNALFDEVSRMKEQLEDRTKLNESLQNQLSQRPSGSELVSLQKTVSGLQQQVSVLRQEKEEEHRQWQERYNNSTKQVNDLQMKVKELQVEKSSKIEQIVSLQTAVTASTESRKQTQTQAQDQQQQIITLQHDLNKSQVLLKEKETFIDYLQKQQEEMKNKLQSEVTSKDQASQQVRNLQNQLEENQRQLDNKNARLNELEANLSQKKEDVLRLQTERTDLIAKIEAGEGTETAIAQMKQEKEQLQERLTEAETLVQTQAEDYSTKIEELHREQNKVEEELAKANEKVSRLELSCRETKGQLEQVTQKNEQLNNAFREKSEAYVALEAGKAAEKAVLDNQLRTTQETLQEKLSELSSLQQQHEQVKKDFSSTRLIQANLETKVQSLVGELDITTKESSKLENEIQQKAANITNLEQAKFEEKGNLEKQIKEIKNALENKEKMLSKAQEDWHKSRESSSLRIKGLETQQEQLTQSLTSAQQHIENKESKLRDLEKEFARVKEEKANLEGQHAMVSQSLQEKSAELTRETNRLNEEHQTLREKMSDQGQTSKQEMSNLMAALRTVKEKLEGSKASNEEKEKQLQVKQEQVVQLSTDLSEAQDAMIELGDAHQVKITNMETELTNKLKEKENIATEMQSRLDKKDEKLNEHQRKVEVLEAEVQKQCEGCKNYESQLCKTQAALKEEQDKVYAFESQLLILTTEIKDLQGQIMSGEEELQRARIKSEETESSLRQSVEQLNELSSTLHQLLINEDKGRGRHLKIFQIRRNFVQVKNNLEVNMMNLENELKGEKTRGNTLAFEKQVVAAEVTKLSNSLIELRESSDIQLAELRSTMDSERKHSEKVMEEAQQKQQLLISQKLGLENQLSSTKQDLAKSREENHETKEVSKRVQMVLHEEKTALLTKLNNEGEEKKEIQERMEHVEARLNIQIASLAENLSVAQTYAAESDKKTQAIENRFAEEGKKSDGLRGDIAVLEATVQNNLDERRKLLERCVASEEYIEKMKKDIHLGKKRTEESQAAMMELTQENQNLQIVNNQMSTRRWEVDDDVMNCNSCDKSFSFSIRKHHCRNCGLIFCNECTARTATIASSKKPVRVCGTCYNDVTTGSIKKYQLQPNQGFS